MASCFKCDLVDNNTLLVSFSGMRNSVVLLNANHGDLVYYTTMNREQTGLGKLVGYFINASKFFCIIKDSNTGLDMITPIHNVCTHEEMAKIAKSKFIGNLKFNSSKYYNFDLASKKYFDLPVTSVNIFNSKTGETTKLTDSYDCSYFVLPVDGNLVFADFTLSFDYFDRLSSNKIETLYSKNISYYLISGKVYISVFKVDSLIERYDLNIQTADIEVLRDMNTIL